MRKLDRITRSSLPLVAVFSAADPGTAAARQAEGDPASGPKVRYEIEARLDESTGTLRGRARVTYHNRSPDILRQLHFHQHLNAFRPNSIWAREERRARYDFQALADPDHAYERLLGARRLPAGAGGADIVGRDLRFAYPHAPDSTVLVLYLTEPLPPGGSIAVELDWEARPSTLCRRQCREGRHYDWAQWYPRIAVYDEEGWRSHPLYPQGEFFGEFATYDVTLELPGDQVVGATGVPVSGDPGWSRSATGPVATRADAYDPPDRPRLGLLARTPTRGWKRVRFYAERVHHFAWSANPEYRYEGGEVPPREGRPEPVAIHVLYRPGDEQEWGGGRAVERTVRALSWLEEVFGPYPWPQLTNVHRLEGGGTEFPMLIMDGSASQGLIVHETAHQYVHGILANNEWAEAWLDEGFASFLTTWFFEGAAGETASPWRETRERMAEAEAELPPTPIATRSEAFPNFGAYGYMSYTRPSFVFHMLRGLVGEPTFRAILQTYYDRHALSHVTEEDLRAVAEEVSGRDLDWFFDQWLHTTHTLDYAVGEVEVEETEEGWRTRVEVLRRGEAWMPLTVQIGPERVTLTSRSRRQVAEVVTGARPSEVLLDPDALLLDADPSNDRKTIGEP